MPKWYLVDGHIVADRVRTIPIHDMHKHPTALDMPETDKQTQQ